MQGSAVVKVIRSKAKKYSEEKNQHKYSYL